MLLMLRFEPHAVQHGHDFGAQVGQVIGGRHGIGGRSGKPMAAIADVVAGTAAAFAFLGTHAPKSAAGANIVADIIENGKRHLGRHHHPIGKAGAGKVRGCTGGDRPWTAIVAKA